MSRVIMRLPSSARDVVGGDLLRETLRNGGLTDAGLADEAGVVLGAAARICVK